MNIRKVKQQDIANISSVCIEAFMHSVAPNLSSEGIDTFRQIASIDSFISRLKGDNTILVCELKGVLKGIVELKEGRHVAMLFVVPESQQQGIGRQLLSEAMYYTRANTITVSASLTSVPAYLKYGFVCTGEPDEKSGLKFQPMELYLDTSR